MIRTLIAIAALAPSGTAFAQPHLISSTPAKDASIGRPNRISLAFSEPIEAATSGLDLVMTGMPGMADHPPMPIKGFTTSVGSDGKTLATTLPRALPIGTYDLSWHAVGADGKKAEGKFAFRVR